MSYEKRYSTIDLLPDVAVGIKLPLVSKSGVLFDLSYSTEEQAISNLKNLILTRRGERIMEPLFGTRLQDRLFEQNTDDLIESIKNDIYDAVSFWLPYISIRQLSVKSIISVTGALEENGVTVSLVVSVNNQDSEVPITFLITPSVIEEL